MLNTEDERLDAVNEHRAKVAAAEQRMKQRLRRLAGLHD